MLFNKAKTSLITYPAGKYGANYTIPNGVMYVDLGAFWGCYSVTNIVIPSSVTGIDCTAFHSCGLENLTIKGNPYIRGNFYYSMIAFDLTSISVTGNFKLSDKKASFPNVTHVTILGDAPNIVDGAYEGCSNLTSITISTGVTSIGDRAFYQCLQLTGIVIPYGVTMIGNGAFGECSNLVEITIPDSVTSIGYSAFFLCSKITEIVIPNGVTSISANAFGYCYNLGEITIPDSVTSIGAGAFYENREMYNILIGNSVTSIGNNAFTFTSIRNVAIPASVATIGDQAFSNCWYLERAIFLGNAPPLADGIFDKYSEDLIKCTVYYSSAAEGFSTPTWRGYAAFPASPPSFTSQPPPPCRVGSSYGHILTAGNTPPTTSMKVSSGTLPPGLYLSMDQWSVWRILGSPTLAGVYTGIITASNGYPPDATQEFSIDTNSYQTLTAAGAHGKVSGSGNYLLGATAMLTATPDPGYLFANWTGGVTGADNPFYVLMNADKTITANFGPDTNDNDEDGLTNYQEIVEVGSNPTIPDTDGDTVKDGDDAFPLDMTEWLDTDRDGTGDNVDTDDDGDGYPDEDEINIYGTNPKRADSDGDGLSDPAELQTHLTNPNIADTDNDGLSDGAEVNTHGTLPKVPDTDGDGFLDGYEFYTGKSPLDPLDKPALVAEARTAIEFTFPSALGKTYRIEDSLDLATWETVESGIAGNGGQIQRFYSTRNVPKRYFRVEEDGP